MCLTTFVYNHIFHLLIMCSFFSFFFFLLPSTTISKCLSIFPLESVINTVTSIQCLSLYLLIINSNRFSNPLRTISLSRLIRSGEKELFHSLLHSSFYLYVLKYFPICTQGFILPKIRKHIIYTSFQWKSLTCIPEN